MALGFRAEAVGVPKGPYVVPFWVCYGFWRGIIAYYPIIPEKELHSRVWVGRALGLGVNR